MRLTYSPSLEPWKAFSPSIPSSQNGEDVKTVQELLRHANSKITLDTYTQAMSPAKRQAQSKVARMILPKKTAGQG